VSPAHVVPAANLGTDQENNVGGQDGTKLSAIVKKANEIIKGGDRIIVFCQFDDLKEKVVQALQRNGVKSVEVKGSVQKQVKALAPFLKETPAKDDPRVLLLRMDHESASGLNLTHLNHAIFVHPLLAANQQQYEAYETQSIGRIRRFGQLKHVNVWRFLVKDSVETGIYEQRTGRSLQNENVDADADDSASA
jgi:SNF2 family DNA or RNA helicase